MSLVDDYLTDIKPRIEIGIDSFLQTARNELLNGLEQSAWDVVYSYKAKPRYERERRYRIGDRDNMASWVSEHTLTIENHEHLRSGEPGEADIVQSGYESYAQPYPRPFMDVALYTYLDSGDADAQLRDALESVGIEAKVDFISGLGSYSAGEDIYGYDAPLPF